MRTLALLAILTAALTAVGCASHRAGDTGNPGCDVLTRDEAAAGMGEPVSRIVAIAPDRCRYFGANPADFITIRTSPTGGHTQFEGSALGAGMLHLPRPASAGIGDESYWAQRVLWVRKGDAFLAIDMGTAATDQRAAGEKLARIAVSRL